MDKMEERQVELWKRYGKYGSKVSWIVKWYGKYGRKASWKWKDMENMENK